MKDTVEIYSRGYYYYFLWDGKEQGGFPSKEAARKAIAHFQKYKGKRHTGKMKKVRTGPIQMGNTRLIDAKRQKMLNKSEWFDLLKKQPSRREKKQRKYTYKVPKGVYDNPKLRARIHRRLWAKNTHGTGKYQWSARKSQELNRLYQKAGGGFVNKK